MFYINSPLLHLVWSTFAAQRVQSMPIKHEPEIFRSLRIWSTEVRECLLVQTSLLAFWYLCLLNCTVHQAAWYTPLRLQANRLEQYKLESSSSHMITHWYLTQFSVKPASLKFFTSTVRLWSLSSVSKLFEVYFWPTFFFINMKLPPNKSSQWNIRNSKQIN